MQGNYVGTDVAGLAPLGNLQTGITIDGATGTLVGTDGNGDANAAERNVIAATDLTGGGPTFGHGVLVTGAGASGNTVAGNFIGTDATGANPLGNAGSGVMVYSGPTNTTVGGATAARANVIAFNLKAGVTVEAGADPTSGTTIPLNSIFANYGLGIDLGGDHAVTINDPGDADTGANGLLSFPVVNGATAVGNALVVTGFAPNGTMVDLYATDTTPDASGFGQGKTYLRTHVVSSALTGTYGPKPLLGALLGTDTTNRFTAVIPFPTGFSTLSRVTAIAWDGSGSSEFGNNAPVLIGALSVGVSPPTVPEGSEVTLAGNFPVADPSHTHTLLIDWGDGSSETHAIRAGVAGFAIPHRYLDDNAADSFPIAVTVIDDVTGFAQSSTGSAAVTNVAPTVRIVSSGANADGSTVILTAQVTDPGVNDTFTYLWTIVSNGTATTFTGKSFTLTRSLATSSVISVTVTDDDGDSDSDTTAVRALTPGNDTLDGAGALTDSDVPAGADRLVVLALAGNDLINASAMTRPVEIVGDDGHDTLTGGSGADILDDGHGDDQLRGNGGDDVYRLTPGSDDVISELSGGTTGADTGGRDRVDFSRAESGIEFGLDEPGVAQVVSAGNTVTAYGVFEDLAGSAFADELTGNDLDNEVYGGLGTDTIAAGDGDDVIFGGTPPNDTVATADGDDVIYGGIGSDTISAGDGGDVIFGGPAPGDTVGAGADDDVIFGGAGDDVLVGNSGADAYVFAGSNLGSDTVVAIKDNGEGVLDFSGLPGGGAMVDLAATGKQLVNPNLNLTLQNTGGIRTVIGTPFDDTFSGDGLDNTFLGGDGTDRVVQAGGSFTLTASTLTGAGTDLLDGIEVVELTGGPGADVLEVDGWTGLAELDGAGGGDDYVVTFNEVGGQVVVHDGGTVGPDRLFVNATAGPDLVVIQQWSVGRGPELVQFDSTVELVTVDGLAGMNTAQFGKPAPTVQMVLLNFGAPTVAMSGVAAVNEGASYTLTLGAISNVTPGSVTAYKVDWGDGEAQTFLGSPVGQVHTHTYADGTNATRTISLLLTIAGVPVAAGSKAVVVNNVAPTVGAITTPLDPQTVNTAITASATFSDPAGVLDGPYTATWNWGDGSSETVLVPRGCSASREATRTRPRASTRSP